MSVPRRGTTEVASDHTPCRAEGGSQPVSGALRAQRLQKGSQGGTHVGTWVQGMRGLCPRATDTHVVRSRKNPRKRAPRR